MSEVATRIPIDRASGLYKRDWLPTQAEQVSRPPLVDPLAERRTPTMTAADAE